METLALEKRLDYKSYRPVSLGCMGCPEFGICGGIQVEAGVYDCMAFCTCEQLDNCQYVCRRDLERFVARSNEVGGYDFDNVPRSTPLKHEDLPLVVPVLFHRSSRIGVFHADTVAIKLNHLINYRKGKLRFDSKDAVAEHFRFNKSARLVITGVDKDQFIEPYWGVIYGTGLVKQLHRLSPSLITTPNYSLFLNAPRWDHFHNMKRIIACWEELNSCGLPASLHVNAFTDRDWQRWLDFIGERNEVKSITVEFGTGLARRDSGRRYIDKLLWLAYQVPRELHIVIRGGISHLREILRAYGSVTLLDTSSFIKTMKRKKIEWQPGNARVWRSVRMEKTAALDDLLQLNADRVIAMYAHQVGQ